MQLIYNVIIIPLLYLIFRIGFIFNIKIRKGVKGRKYLFSQLIDELNGNTKIKVWFHVSSYGEFEQAKPVLLKLKEKNPDIYIIVTFFSPSAYEHIKATPPVDYICYLPFDSLINARRFISIINPQLAVIVRHDIWPNFLWTLSNNNIPTILIDASLPEKSSRFWPLIRNFNKKLFNHFSEILTISKDENKRFEVFITDKSRLIVTGDTKFDQVYYRTLETEKIKSLLNHSFLLENPIWVIGSSWPSDEKYIIPAYKKIIKKNTNLILIIAPHETAEDRIKELENHLEKENISSIRLSELKNESNNFQALIVDRIGILANIYRLGEFAFVGGSMELKVHNVLEPAAHGIPVLFGPRITTQAEALELKNGNGAILVSSTDEIFKKVSMLLKSKEEATRIGNNAKQFVLKFIGAADKTVEVLTKYLEVE